MKKLYTLFVLFFVSALANAQCMATMDVQANGNEVTVTIIGSGASLPFYTIDWGDGGSDFSPSATHVYTEAGTYTITFVYADLSNTECLQTASQQVIITGTGCAMDFDLLSFGLTATVNVVASGAGAPAYTIDWGDGSVPDYESQAAHVYAQAGTYNVCVTFQDFDNLDNCTLILCEEVTVASQSGDCSVTLTAVVEGSFVVAEAEGIGAAIENYVITWGDNTFDQGMIGEHSYEVAGTYNVCAIYGDLTPGGCVTQDCEEVVVQKIGSCTLEITAIPLGFTVGLNGTGTGAVNPEYSIEWGDLSPTESALPATHTYSAPGNYQICVSYVDLDNLKGCQVVECVNVVIEEPITDCTAELTVTVDGNIVTATVVGEGADAPQYGISWGDGTFPALESTATHTYATADEYEVCGTYLDLSNFQTCNVTVCETITITVGVDEYFSGENAVSVYPNPLASNSMLQVELARAAHVQIDVIDVVGNLVATVASGERGQGTQRFAWDTEALASGVYFVRVIANNDEQTIRVIR